MIAPLKGKKGLDPFHSTKRDLEERFAFEIELEKQVEGNLLIPTIIGNRAFELEVNFSLASFSRIIQISSRIITSEVTKKLSDFDIRVIGIKKHYGSSLEKVSGGFLYNDQRFELKDISVVITPVQFWIKGEVACTVTHIGKVTLKKLKTQPCLFIRILSEKRQEEIKEQFLKRSIFIVSTSSMGMSYYK